MKKITLSISFLFLLFITTTAQVTIKPHVGMNFSLFTEDPIDYDDPGVRVGVLLGLGAKFGEDFYIEPAVQYGGSTYELVHANNPDQDFNAIFRGLRIPVSFGYQFGDNDDLLRFRLFAGPSATIMFDVEVESGSNAQGLPKSEDFNTIIWGANMGLGLDVWFLYLETGYDIGLSNVYNGESSFDVGKNNMFWFALGVNIGG